MQILEFKKDSIIREISNDIKSEVYNNIHLKNELFLILPRYHPLSKIGKVITLTASRSLFHFINFSWFVLLGFNHPFFVHLINFVWFILPGFNHPFFCLFWLILVLGLGINHPFFCFIWLISFDSFCRDLITHFLFGLVNFSIGAWDLITRSLFHFINFV